MMAMIQKTCNDCYHCIEVAEDGESFRICGLHNAEIEQEYCGLFEVRNGEILRENRKESRKRDSEAIQTSLEKY